MRRLLLPLLLAVCAGALPAAAQQSGEAVAVPPLVPHQALYGLRVVKPEGATLQGSLAIEVARDCAVWNVKFVVDVTAKGADGEEWSYRRREHYRETLDGKAMGFRVETESDGDTTVATGGGAFETREAPGSYEVFRDGAQQPETGELPVNTLFAATSTRLMLRELQAGRKSFGLQVFDAVNDLRPKVQQVNLLRESFDRSDLPLNDNPLLAGDAWLIRVTEVHDEQAVNTNMVLHDTGIVSVMGLQMGEMVMQAELNLLTRLAPPSC